MFRFSVMTDKPPTTPRPPPGYSVNDDAALARALQMNEYQPALSNPVNTNPSVTPAAAETGAQPGYAGAAQAPPPQYVKKTNIVVTDNKAKIAKAT